jgi:hypothetical protein
MRLERLKDALEQAAQQGCYSLEVGLNDSFGTPSW